MLFLSQKYREMLREKSLIRETKNLPTDADSRTDTITFFIKKLQVMDVLFEETD